MKTTSFLPALALAASTSLTGCGALVGGHKSFAPVTLSTMLPPAPREQTAIDKSMIVIAVDYSNFHVHHAAAPITFVQKSIATARDKVQWLSKSVQASGLSAYADMARAAGFVPMVVEECGTWVKSSLQSNVHVMLGGKALASDGTSSSPHAPWVRQNELTEISFGPDTNVKRDSARLQPARPSGPSQVDASLAAYRR